ncbi:glycosyltransferase family 4 protein [Candidatus Woesearchaeota archaeon]|jgi:glycosyltransferase involved in cell wall biosynthesis|nr:glycosyltransferase family 4 protein [Candidatus Woesearchaeota archaeon]
MEENQKETKQKKKLLIASDCFLPRWDGITRFLIEIIPKLKEDYDITLIAPEFPGELKLKPVEGINIVRFPIMKLKFGDINFSWFHYFKIKKLMKEHDLLFSQTIGPIGMSAIKAAKKLKKPSVAFIHSVEWELATKSIDKLKLIINMGMKMLIKHYYNKVSLLLVPSLEVGELYRKNGVSTQYKVVHLGTDVNKFVPVENKADAKKALNIDPNFTVIGFSGRIGREKNLITLYRAFRRIEKKYENLKLLIIGKGIKSLEQEFSSQRNIIMPGSVNGVVSYLQAMDIFVLPSLTETSSLATMEAMACGLPIVTTPVGYVKDYIVEKENGMFFPFKNSLVLSLKLEMLLKDDNLRVKLGRQARETIVDRFSWDKTSTKIREYLGYF